MQITINVSRLGVVRNALQQSAKQATFAASKALNATAFDINKRIKADMQSIFEGGATPYAQRAFKVETATKVKLEARVYLRTDAPAGGTAYDRALAHLFTGGTRDWKKVENHLTARKLMPQGQMLVPGPGVQLDARGNIPRRVLAEMLGVLSAPRTNLRVYRKTGAGKASKAVGYFVAMPGERTTSKLHPGIYKRTETGSSSAVTPMVLYVRPGNWRRFIDLKAIGDDVVGSGFEVHFRREFATAMATAK